MIVEDLPRPPAEQDIAGLAALLVDAVAAGASVGFLPPLPLEEAARWWRESLPHALVLVARDADGIAGTVQLQPARAANQPHRAEVAKLLVHRRARRRGLGRALMAAVEARARVAGFTLLTLDTKRGDAAESLYRRLGWTCAGVIPGYALDAAGTPCATVVFYRALGDGV